MLKKKQEGKGNLMSKHRDYERYRKECEEVGREDFYDHLIEEGNNPGFAAMLAMQRPAGTKGTERAFLQGQHNWADKISYEAAEALHWQAKKAGISTQGKKYIGGLGRPTDPQAWISTQDDVRGALKRKGLSAVGGVNYKAPEQEFKKKRMGNDVIQRFMAEELQNNPDLAKKVKKNPKKLQDLKNKVIQKHSKKNLRKK